MKILDFIISLLPRMNKSDILEDIKITETELDSCVIPNYKAAGEHFGSNKFKSASALELSKIYYRNVGYKHNLLNFISDIDRVLPNVKANLAMVTHEINTIMEKDIIKEGLSAKKTVLLRAAEQMSFVTRFSIDLLNFIYSEEAIKVGAEVSEDFVTEPVVRRRIEKNFVIYVRLLSAYAVPVKDTEGKYKNVPDIVLNETNFSLVSSVYKEEAVDPFSGALVAGFEANPIYHFRLMIAEWQANRYKAYKDKKQMLELNLLNLKMQEEETPDPKLEKEIIYLQGRIQTIERKMAKMEEDVK